ncbi:MAG TPA: sugar ABC transporter permease [Actinomycetota bacterium]|nr:sugar ABC transporter permease [Actinomycetota bacterium]
MNGGGRGARGLLAVLALAGVLAVGAIGLDMLRDATDLEHYLANALDFVGLDASASSIRDNGLTPGTSKTIIAVLALVLGVGGVWALFVSANRVVDLLGRFAERIRPLVFVGPAVALLGFALVYPAISTIVTSLREDGGAADNYRFAFTDPDMLVAFRNNVLWLVVGTAVSVLIGLLFAALVDRVKREAFAKTFIFLPLAISLVGASVIWRFVYAWRPEGEPQIGVVNAVGSALGAEPVPWLQTPPVNTFALIAIMIWLQTGFAMVVLSAALKGVPVELIEAARIDGASEPQLFFKVVLPSIRGAILTVATAIFIAILKVFDIVFVMTGGRFDTEVVANRMFTEMFKFRNFGRASALAVVLMIVVVPFMVLNIRNMRRQEAR